jgi:hypothetical protein
LTPAEADDLLSRVARELPAEIELGQAVALERDLVVTAEAVYLLLAGPGPTGVLRAIEHSPTSYQVTRWAKGRAMERRWWCR